MAIKNLDEIVGLAMDYGHAKETTNNAQLAVDIATEALERAREAEAHYLRMLEGQINASTTPSPFEGLVEGANKILTLQGTAKLKLPIPDPRTLTTFEVVEEPLARPIASPLPGERRVLVTKWSCDNTSHHEHETEEEARTCAARALEATVWKSQAPP